MRKRDMHILSAGILMYTSDLRFQVIHPDKSENWTLQIKSPQQRDSGVYECQVSTEPKMSLNYSLNVVGECRLNYSHTWPGYINRGLGLILFEIFSRWETNVTTVSRSAAVSEKRLFATRAGAAGSNGLKFKRLSAPSWDYPSDVASRSEILIV
ncbi:Uncharacterized protein DBV15_07186 [Temnothorax longispinosus]|uniref:Ig-like domain-containing protein n=1 Tax=Temnothorax longispinosus TaxID=300112 RepID=A0A4S2JTZ9_9HYME|nr:Uncharacterized protein DBV15_07186 [Temnothorax longispinosus]